MVRDRFRALVGATLAGIVAGACSATEPARLALTSTVAPTATSVPANESVGLTFTFRDVDGTLIASAPVTLSTTLSGAVFSPAAGTTTQNGEFTTVFQATNAGNAPVTASVGGRTAVVLPQFSVCAPVELGIPAIVAGSVVAGQCFSADRSNALYRFTLGASGVVSLSAAAVFAPTLAITPLTPDDHIIVAAPASEAVEWVLPVGTYQARVGAASGSGAFSLTSQFVAGNSGCVQRYLAIGATIAGQTLSAGDCDFGDGTKFDSYGVYSSRPCSIRLQTTEFTPFLWLYDVETFQINGTTGGAPGNDAVLGLPACKYLNAPIFIWVNTDVGETGGGYTLAVSFYDPPPAATVAAPATLRLPHATPVRPAMTRAALSAMRAQVTRGMRGRQ